MTLPHLFLIMCGSEYLVQRNAPVSMTPIRRFQLLFGEIDDRRNVLQPRVVDQDVEAPILFHGGVDKVLHLVGIGDADLNEKAL